MDQKDTNSRTKDLPRHIESHKLCWMTLLIHFVHSIYGAERIGNHGSVLVGNDHAKSLQVGPYQFIVFMLCYWGGMESMMLGE